MILLDAIYINNGGGKILLDYLITKFESEKLSIFYLLDNRIKNNHPKINESNNFIYLNPSLFERHKFYIKNKNKFKKILCFGNLPPTITLNIPVYTYFHQPMFLNIPKEYTFKSKATFSLKQFFLNMFKKNTDAWIVQNEFMKKGLMQKYSLKCQKVLILPFYPDDDLSNDCSFREKNTFIYVSNAGAHKNHLRLLSAFCSFYDACKTGKLIITVSPIYHDIYKRIENLKSNGYPIENIGFVERKELINNYHKAEYLIFPSLEESFGLGLVEAIGCGCKVIGANLPYLFQACNPSLTFDPTSIKSIEDAFYKAINKQEYKTEKLINNQIDQLLELININ